MGQSSENNEIVDKRCRFYIRKNIFAGKIKCGDCGRSMSKTTWKSAEKIEHILVVVYKDMVQALQSAYDLFIEEIILKDINSIISTVSNLKKELAEEKYE